MPAEDLQRIDPELRQQYANFTDKFVVTEQSLAGLRSGGGMSKPPPLPEDIEMLEVVEGNVKGLIYRPKDPSVRQDAGVVFIHGGGFIFGRPGIHQLLYIRLVDALKVTVFAPQYRLAPEHPFPAAHDDVYDAWNWFAKEAAAKYGLDASKTALGGTSAGGGLAFGLALRLRDEGLKPASCLLGNIPFFSGTYGESLNQPDLEKCWGSHNCSMALKWYTPPGTEDPKKYAWVLDNPSYANLPPASITAAELDTLRDGAIAVAARMMSESGNGCELHVWRGAFHGSVSLNPNAVVSKAQDDTMISFIRRYALVKDVLPN